MYLESSAAEASTSEASATESASVATTVASVATGTIAGRHSGTFAHLAACLLGAKEVHAIDDMEHGIARNGVILGVGALHGRDRTTEVGLLLKDIIELQREGERIVTKEALTNLLIPYHFVGIQRLISISSSAVHVQVSSNRHVPGQKDVGVETVGEIPCIEVGIGLQLIGSMIIT